MSAFAKVFVVLALVSSLASAADCTSGHCHEEHDETSLLQVNKNMQQGSDKKKESEDSVEIPESEEKAFKANKHKVEAKVAEAAAHRLAFEKSQERTREHARQETETRLKADKDDILANARANKLGVDAAIIKHRNVEDAAVEKVNSAKDKFEKVAIQKGHVQNAAIAGRRAGINSGIANAAEKEHAAEEAEIKAIRAKEHAEELKAEAKHARQQEDAINHETNKKVAENQAIGDRADQNAREANRHMDDNADAAEHAIKSRDAHIEHLANGHADEYEQRTKHGLDRIHSAEKGDWPEDDE